MKFLLDTNAWIEVMNNPTGLVAIKLAANAPSDIALASVVLGELLVGAYKSSQSAANSSLIHQLTRQFAEFSRVPGLNVEDWLGDEPNEKARCREGSGLRRSIVLGGWRQS